MAQESAGTVLHYMAKLFDAGRVHHLTDSQLLARFVNDQDESAFASLTERHWRLVWRVCRQILADDQDAEDAFQAAFLILAQYAGSIRRGQTLAGWLYRVAYRTAVKASKDRARRSNQQRQVQGMARAKQASELTWRELQQVLGEELERLPEKYRTPFVLCCLEEKSKPEVARALGWKEGTVSSRLAEARKRLQKRLSARGLALSAVLCTAGFGDSFGSSTAPPFLVRTTIKSALLSASGQAGATGVSAKVLALVAAVSRGMAAAKARLLAPFLVALAVVATGAGMLAYQGLQSAPTEVKETQRHPEPEQPRGAAPRRNARTDRYGDPLPEGALTRLGTIRFRLGNGLYHMALAPDGKTAVSVGGNAQTQFWDVATGKEIRRIEWKQGGGGRIAAYSADSRWVATVDDRGVLHLWESTTGKDLAQLHLKMDFTSSLSFSPDTTILAAGGASNKYGRSEETTSDSVISLWRWNGESLQPLWQAKPDHEAPIKGPRSQGIKSLAFSPDGKHLATGGLNNSMVRIWNAADGKEILRIKASGTQVGAVAFAADGKVLASGSDDGRVAFWDPATGTKLRDTKQPGEVRALAFSPDARIVAAGGGPEYGWNKGTRNEPFLHLLDASDGKEIRRLGNIREGVAALGISKDGRVLAAGLGGVIRCWEPTSGKELSINAGHQHWISELDISENGQLAVTAGGDGPIILWDLATGAEKLRLRGHTAEARAVRFVPGGKLVASAGTDQKVYLWDLTTGQLVQQLDGSPKGMTYSVAVSADGKTLAAGDYSDGTIHIWDLVTGKLVHQVKVGDQIGDGVMRLAFAPSGKVLAVGETALNAMRARQEREEMDARIQLWDVTTGNKLREIPAHKYCVKSLAFSPDGRVLASIGWSDRCIKLWDAETGKKLFEFPCDCAGGVVRFSPDGRILAWANSMGRIGLWEMASKKRRREFQGHVGAINSLVFSPDGKTLLSGSMDTTALVWDVTGLRNHDSAPGPLSEQKRLSLWQALASSDGAEAGRAIWSLAADPKGTVPFIVERVRDLSTPDAQRISQFIADLDSESFRSREAAEMKLEGLGNLAAPALREALAPGVPLEVRRRIDRLLEKRESPIQSPEALQALRAIEVLERVGTPAARQALDNFASQTSEAYFQQEARMATQRLLKQSLRQSE
jgi:RNA polymerase sigma factor (sigma-70 family)